MMRVSLLILTVVAGCQALPAAISARYGSRDWDDYKDHVVLTEADVAGKRVLVLGDVHGCMGELSDMLTKADLWDASGTRLAEDAILILAGDWINKGPRSAEVLRFVRANENVYGATGNHELNVLNDPESSKYPWSAELTEDEWDWLIRNEWSVSLPDGEVNVTVVHAGLMPGVALEDQEEFVLTRMRDLIPDGSGGYTPSEDRVDEGFPWATIWEGPNYVVFGHDKGRGLQQQAWATGLDTGCVGGDVLTGLWFPVREQHLIEVPCEEWDP